MERASRQHIRLVIADHQPLLCEGLRSLFAQTSDIEVVGTATTAAETERLVERVQPHVVLFDVELPGSDGVMAVTRLRQRYPAVQIMLLASHLDPAAIRASLHAGAINYILRDISATQLTEVVRAAHAGQSMLQSQVASALVAEVARFPLVDALIYDETLSPRERGVLQLVAAHYSNAQIAATLGISEGTVKNHLTNIFGKLGVHDRHHAVQQARVRNLI